MTHQRCIGSQLHTLGDRSHVGMFGGYSMNLLISPTGLFYVKRGIQYVGRLDPTPSRDKAASIVGGVRRASRSHGLVADRLLESN